MQYRVDRVAAKPELALDVVQESRRVKRQLEYVVQPLGSVAHAEHVSELTKSAPRQPVAGRKLQDVFSSRPMQRSNPLAVVGIAIVVTPVALEHALVRTRVDVVDGTPRAGEPPVTNASRRPSGAIDR